MRHVNAFNTFLKEVVNLNDERIKRLEGHVEAIEKFLRPSDYGATIKGFSAQGSWAHKTIIRPVDSETRFDADLVMFVRPKEDWTPKDYVADLYRVFRASGVYKEKVGRNTRCVMVEYAKDFDLDVVPVICREPDALATLMGDKTSYSVCNRVTDKEEPTDPLEYTKWLAALDKDSKGKLRKVTRLVKYLRDIKMTFSVKSILLTTLLGNRVEERLKLLYWDDPWADVPTALRTIVDDLDDWLQARPIMPEVENPKVPGETFTRHWDQDKYENFRTCIHRYREWIDDAYNEADEQESLTKWRRVFGQDFAPEASAVTASAVVAKSEGVADDRQLVREAARRGLAYMNSLAAKARHVVPVPWTQVQQRLPVTISATLHRVEGGPAVSQVANGLPIRGGFHIRFFATVGMGALPAGWKVRWRITNTGSEAASEKSLRGDLSPKSKGNGTEHWEYTRYIGVHWVEAFAVNARGQCMGQSDRFFVVIDDANARVA